jgi:Kef-type K+ transport system membrane component KefB
MATSPVLTIVVQHDLQARGQVTERLLLMAALNSMAAALALKVWRVVALADAPATEWQPALLNAVYVLSGSFVLGTAAGLVLRHLTGLMRGAINAAVLQLALLILAAMLAVQFTLSPLLALLITGMVARQRLGHGLRVEPQLGTAGAALTVLLFLSFGLLSSFEGLAGVWPWVLAIILARLAGKAGAVLALARPSGLGWRQSLGLALALQPMSNLPVLLSVSTFGWPANFPAPDQQVLQAVLIATALMQLTGPWWTLIGLKQVARECPSEARLARAP